MREFWSSKYLDRALKFGIFQRVRFFPLAWIGVSGEGEINSYLLVSNCGDILVSGKFLITKTVSLL